MFTMFTTFTRYRTRSSPLSAIEPAPRALTPVAPPRPRHCRPAIACPPLRCAPPACPTRQHMSIALLPACPLTARRSSTSAPTTPSQLTVHPRGGIVQAAKPASKVAKAACFGNAAAKSGGQSHLSGSFKRGAAVAFCTHLCFPW